MVGSPRSWAEPLLRGFFGGRKRTYPLTLTHSLTRPSLHLVVERRAHCSLCSAHRVPGTPIHTHKHTHTHTYAPPDRYQAKCQAAGQHTSDCHGKTEKESQGRKPSSAN